MATAFRPLNIEPEPPRTLGLKAPPPAFGKDWGGVKSSHRTSLLAADDLSQLETIFGWWLHALKGDMPGY
jgi:hypothetical protein